MVGRFTPGTFTNQIKTTFRRRRLPNVTDPYCDHQPITEASYVNIPVIALCTNEATEVEYNVEIIEDSSGALRLKHAITGARILEIMKGAVDGGLNIPHSTKRLLGYDGESEAFNAEVLGGHIMTQYVADCMRLFEDQDPEGCKRQFNKYIILGITTAMFSRYLHPYLSLRQHSWKCHSFRMD
ncbi:putative component of the ribosome [Trypoxylus dichotomus]